MSRIGKLPIPVPGGVQVKIENREVQVDGPKGSLTLALPPLVNLAEEDGTLHVTPVNATRQARAQHGLGRSLIANMIEGVTQGYVKRLEIQGVGYRAQVKDNVLNLSLGFSHPVEFPAPDGIQIEVAENTKITVSGADKQVVGETAAKIRHITRLSPTRAKAFGMLASMCGARKARPEPNTGMAFSGPVAAGVMNS